MNLQNSSYKVPLILDRFFKNPPNIKFHEVPSSASRDIPCGQKYGHTDMTKLTVTFRNFANMPEKS